MLRDAGHGLARLIGIGLSDALSGVIQIVACFVAVGGGDVRV